VLRDHGGPVDLLVADVVMPGMNGRELFDRVAPGHPELAVLYMSGYVDEVIGDDGVIDDGAEFIKKPFTVQGFADKVRQILDSR
jgi:FixJ family two-component response regulator